MSDPDNSAQNSIRKNKSGIVVGEKGNFIPGHSGNPAGKPPGTVSIVAKIKKKFHENPEYFDEWVKKLLEDPANRKAIMEQLDGKPKQSMDMEVSFPQTLIDLMRQS